MSGYRAGKPSWVDPGFYPVEERLGNGMKERREEVLLVDVGGGLGQDLNLLKQKHSHVPGRLILQDKEEVIGQISAPDPVFEAMAHDFFTPQPVHGISFPIKNTLLKGHTDSGSRCARLPPAFRAPRLG